MQNLMKVEDQEHKIVKEEKYLEYIDHLDDDRDHFDKSQSFYYISCETSNNSHFETATMKNLGVAA